jgi:hypothetical protein
MKKIKTKLVTFVTENVPFVGIVGDENLLARMLQERSGKVASKEETQRRRCDNSEETARTCDGPPKSV